LILPKALYRGELPIGGIVFGCYVLDDSEADPSCLLAAKDVFRAFDELSASGTAEGEATDGKGLPFAVFTHGLGSLVTEELKKWLNPVVFMDDHQKKTGHRAEVLPALCSLLLRGRRGEQGTKLTADQERMAKRAEILQEGFARVGIIALVHEATGFQFNRRYDALRTLLQSYLAEKIKKWSKLFPDIFFFQLDRLYGNEKTEPQNRPFYYGRFINTYVYEPIESGKVNEELQKRYRRDDKKNRKHQHFTEFGEDQLRLQIGRVLGLMEVAPHLRWFKETQERQGQLALFSELEDAEYSEKDATREEGSETSG